MLKALALFTVMLVASQPASAASIDVSGYPELAPARLLPPILAELRRTLKDPSSIREFVLCPATKVKLKDGRPVSWSVLLSFNAKNSYGGYEGTRSYGAVFRNGRLSGGLVSTQFGSNEGLEGLANSLLARKMAACPFIPDDRIHMMIGAGGTTRRELEIGD